MESARRLSLFLAFVLILSACAPAAATATASPTFTVTHPRATATYRPTVTPRPTRRIPTLTVTGTATLVPFPSVTLMVLPTQTPTLTPFVYVFPVQPISKATYGEGVAGHGYPATDIFAPVGTRFVAVTAGVVNFVSGEDLWAPDNPDPAARGGLSVAIIGNDGIRYYGSHLSAIADGIYVGAPVLAGQVLGYVGASGDAEGTTSHLHFGISRPSTPDDWKSRRGQVNPFPYLNAWKDGLNLTPLLP